MSERFVAGRHITGGGLSVPRRFELFLFVVEAAIVLRVGIA
ncbi:hypothetical protein [Streptomyces sp. NBC_01497]|nr:hypothetical protein [Streptomyces sp. NBC_01497]